MNKWKNLDWFDITTLIGIIALVILFSFVIVVDDNSLIRLIFLVGDLVMVGIGYTIYDQPNK